MPNNEIPQVNLDQDNTPVDQSADMKRAIAAGKALMERSQVLSTGVGPGTILSGINMQSTPLPEALLPETPAPAILVPETPTPPMVTLETPTPALPTSPVIEMKPKGANDVYSNELQAPNIQSTGTSR